MSTIKNGGLDQYGAKPYEQQESGTAGVEGVKELKMFLEDDSLCGQRTFDSSLYQ